MPVTQSTSTWFLAQLKPNSAQIAERNLHRQGFETFLPLEDVTKRSESKFVQKTRPLFPGYIFVSFEVDQGAWRTVNSTYGVTRLVSFGSTPSPVPLDILVPLKERCDVSGKLVPSVGVRPGDKVQITSGPFVDLVANIERIDSEKRIWILLDLMGAKTKVSVSEESLTTTISAELKT